MDQDNKYIRQNRAEELPPGASSASQGWSAMVQLLDKGMPATKKSKRYFFLLILIPLLFAWPAVNRDAEKQKVFLAMAGKPLVIMAPDSSVVAIPGNEIAVVHARDTHNKQTMKEEIEVPASPMLQDTELNQSKIQQILSRDRDISGTVRASDKKDSGNKKDLSDKKESIADDATELEMQTGLLWSLPMPMGGTQNYFARPDGVSQPYRYALPGAWISLRADNYLFTVLVNPFASSMVQPVVIDSSVYVPDSVTRIVKSNAVSKLFGIDAALHIDRRIGGNWWAGGGLQGNWWQEAVGTVYKKTEKISGPSAGPGSINYQASSAPLSDSSWANLSRFQIFLNGGLIYRTTNWQAGVEAGFSVTPLANSGNPKNLFNAAVFFRLPIITKQIKVNEDQ